MQIAFMVAVAIFISDVLSSPLSSPSSTKDLPGYEDLEVQPELSTSSKHGIFVLGKPTKPINKHAFIKIPLGDGKTMRVPKGIYHYSERSQDFNTNAAVPQLEHPFQASGSYQTVVNNVNGRSLSSDIASGIDGRVKRALAEAQKRCRETANIACEEALRKYYSLRAKQIEQNDATVEEKLIQMSKGFDYNGLGVLIGMPGIEPVYMGAGMDRGADTGTVLDMSLPY